MRVAIVGPGAVGIFTGVHLAQAGHEVCFLYRDSQKANDARRLGLSCTLESGKEVSTGSPSTHTDAKAIGPCDVVLVTTKHHVPSKNELLPLLDDEATLVLPLLNGIEHLLTMSLEYGSHAVVGCVRIFAECTSSTHVKQHGPLPEYVCGSLVPNPEVHERLQRLFATSLTCRILEQGIQEEMWRKFVFITSLSASGALCEVPLQKAYRESEGFQVALHRLTQEAVAVASVCGFAEAVNAVPAVMKQILTSQVQDMTVSMQRDVMAGRDSELESQIGALLRMAHGKVSCPGFEVAYGCLQARERGRRR